MLPSNLSNLFKNKQKSYQMVLVLVLLDEMGNSPRYVPLTKVIKRFHNYLVDRERRNLPIDDPPPSLGKQWGSLSDQQMRSVIDAPIQALSKILISDNKNNKIAFRPEIIKELTPKVITELRSQAIKEMDDYYRGRITLPKKSLNSYLEQILSYYQSSKKEAFSDNPMGTLVRRTVPGELHKLPFLDDRYKVQGSVGMGNWATIPWIAIMDKRITETTQQGVYIVYLFSELQRSVYLTLNQGVTVPLKQGKKAGYEQLQQKVKELRNLLPLEAMQKDDAINLTTAGIGNDYQVSTIAYIRYDRDSLPDDSVLVADLKNVMENYQMYVEHELGINRDKSDATAGVPSELSVHEIQNRISTMMPAEILKVIKSFITERGFHFPIGLIENFYLSLKTKPFVILAGISGTGKTKLIKLFAEALGATEGNGRYVLIPVRPDWSDPSDLLGYTDITGTFRPGAVTEVILEASRPDNEDKPYFICLDEMNLARVEHYFSDLLSILETQHWDNGRIVTHSLLPSEVVQKLQGNLHEGLGPSSLGIPDNVYIIGTVNMDETTHPFSKKVLDRANTLEFNYIELNHFPDEVLHADLDASVLEVPNSFLRLDYLTLKDGYVGNETLVQKTTERLIAINAILDDIHAQIGYRVRDTICFYMVYNHHFELLPEDEAFDLQLLQKILPRIQGSNMSVKRTLIELMLMALGQRGNVDQYTDDASELYLPWRRSGESPKALYPQSTRKLAYMIRRLEEDGFTSFWLS